MNVMIESQFVFRCPHCNDAVFEATPPDSWHSVFSFDEPLMSSLHGEVKTQTITCRNVKCKKPITIYWYAPMEYYNRM